MAVATLKALQKTVPTAGTAVALTASVLTAHGLKIKALPANVGNVVIGASGVTMSTGFVLAAGQEIKGEELMPVFKELLAFDLSKIYVDSANNNDGVCVSYVELSQV